MTTTLEASRQAAPAPSGGAAQFAVQSDWSPPAPPQEVGEIRTQVEAAEAAGRRVVRKYPKTLRRLSDS